MLTRQDIELDFVREFSHSGNHLGPSVSSEERRERIRIAILREQKQDDPFRDTGLSYTQIYKMAYHKPIELRRFPRDVPDPRLHLAAALTAQDEEEDETEEDPEEAFVNEE